MAEDLVRLDPENAEYRRDLAVSHAKLGGVYEQAGEPAKAKAAYLKVVEIFEKMKADGVLAPADEGFIATFQQKADAMNRE